MSNHCDSDLKVTGPREWVDEFLARHVTEDDGTMLDLNSIRPYPAEYAEPDRLAHEWDDRLAEIRRELPREQWEPAFKAFVAEHGVRPKDGFNQGGHEWRLANWGTKWGCYHLGQAVPPERLDDGVLLHFGTAWSPINSGLMQELSARFPHLRFEYDAYERGMQFRERLVLEAGEIVEQGTFTYTGSRGG